MYNIIFFFFPHWLPWGEGLRGGGCPYPGAWWAYPEARATPLTRATKFFFLIVYIIYIKKKLYT